MEASESTRLVGLDAGRSPAARSSITARWRRRKELRRATPSSNPSAAANAGAEDAEAWRRWRECAAAVGDVEVEEVVRRCGESGVGGASRNRDLRRDDCGFGGRDGDGEGGAEEAKGSETEERGGEEMDARCRISSPTPPGCQFLHVRRRRKISSPAKFTDHGVSARDLRS